MDVRVKATQSDVPSKTRKYLDGKISTIEKLLGADAELARLEVEILRAAGNQRHDDHMWLAEFTLRYPGGPQLRATNHAATVNQAIDDAKDELARQLRTEKQTHRRLTRKTGSAIKRLLRIDTED